jgi:hypothetical protein
MLETAGLLRSLFARVLDASVLVELWALALILSKLIQRMISK